MIVILNCVGKAMENAYLYEICKNNNIGCNKESIIP